MNALSHKKRTIILFCGGVFLFFFLLILFVFRGKNNSFLPFFPAPTPIQEAGQPTPVVKTSLLSFHQLSPNSVAVIIDSTGHPVSAVQLEIGYDPSLLTHVDINPGPYFTSPLVLTKSIDTTNGSMFYALGTQFYNNQPKGSGTVAIITFQVTPGLSNKATLSFQPQTKVTEEGVDNSVLKQSSDSTFTVSSGQ